LIAVIDEIYRIMDQNQDEKVSVEEFAANYFTY
jgi:hypothetical protein